MYDVRWIFFFSLWTYLFDSKRIGFWVNTKVSHDLFPTQRAPGHLAAGVSSQMEIRSHKTPAFPDCHGVTLIDFKKNYFNVDLYFSRLFTSNRSPLIGE